MDKNLTLNGSGPDLLTVQRSAAQGTPDFGIFETSEGETVNLFEMTISKGKAPGFGGGINANGPLTVTGCKVSNNTGGQGGGINSFSLLNVIASTISNNNSFVGGGINLIDDAVANVTSSTINNNWASLRG